jgi:S1-C subfamily serine protease
MKSHDNSPLSVQDILALSEAILPKGIRSVREHLTDDLTSLVTQVARRSARELEYVAARDDAGLAPVVGRPRLDDAGAGLELLDAELDLSPGTAFRRGSEALTRVEDEGEAAHLSGEEALALEAIVRLAGRPAILIQEGAFFPPPAEWRGALEKHRQPIEKTFISVGRIDLEGHPRLDWVGTGFLVGRDVVMTNRHVAREFVEQTGRGGLRIASGMRAVIDFREEFGGVASAEFELTEVIGIHDQFDLALFRVAGTNGNGDQFPDPLPIAAGPVVDDLLDRDVYVVGYPAWDGRRNDPEPMMRIFSNIFNVKRLQPGKVTGFAPARSLLTHDCSTLGGNSGSSVIDLATQKVVGLHFGGRFRQANEAVALWTLRADPLLSGAGINWV